MTTNMKNAQELLFGADGLGASNFKMFLGFNRDTTPDKVAGNIVSSLTEVIEGRAEDVTDAILGAEADSCA